MVMGLLHHQVDNVFHLVLVASYWFHNLVDVPCNNITFTTRRVMSGLYYLGGVDQLDCVAWADQGVL